MIAHARDEGSPVIGSCVDCVAAGMPLGVRLLLIYDEFCRMPVAMRQKAYAKPMAAARLVARVARCRRISVDGFGPAWGVVSINGRHTFAIRQPGARWWARSARGVTRVHPSYVVAAWEIA